jgi:hypothetical protein
MKKPNKIPLLTYMRRKGGRVPYKKAQKEYADEIPRSLSTKQCYLVDDRTGGAEARGAGMTLVLDDIFMGSPAVLAGRKGLRIWNGRGWQSRKNPCFHLYVCASSVQEAIDLVNKAAGFPAVTRNEVDVYWSADAWGKSMEGIEPVKGVWVHRTESVNVEQVV